MNAAQRKRRDALRTRYETGETIREIADAEGISVSRAQQLIVPKNVNRAAARKRNNVLAILQLVRRTS